MIINKFKQVPMKAGFQISKRFFLFLLLSSLILSSCNTRNQIKEEKKLTVFERIIKDGKIRVGYLSNPPNFIIDPNSKQLSGITYDILNEIGHNLDTKIEYVEEVSFGSMIESLQSERVDVVNFGVWPSSARAKSADFSTSMYYLSVNAYVRKNDNRFNKNLRNINFKDIRIATIDGEMNSIIAKYDFPKASIVSHPQNSEISQLLLDVKTNKADVAFIETDQALDFMKNNPNTIKQVENVAPVRIFANTIMIKKGETNLKTMLDISINELLYNGYIDKAISKNEKYPNSFYRVSIPYTLTK